MMVKSTPDSMDAVSDEAPGSGEIIVVAYDPGRFMTSQEVSLVTSAKDEYFTLYQVSSMSLRFYKQLVL
jgi:hypothetical protein